MNSQAFRSTHEQVGTSRERCELRHSKWANRLRMVTARLAALMVPRGRADSAGDGCIVQILVERQQRNGHAEEAQGLLLFMTNQNEIWSQA